MDPVHTAFLHTIVSGSQFTDEFGQLPELDFTQTPVGMMYIATRRVGDNIWARMVENILPNLQLVAPIWEDGHKEHPFSGPMLSRWVVPVDDTNTLLLELRHVSETASVTPRWWAENVMAPAQLAAESYEAGQRKPGDYEAQVSQRPIAVHGLKHLGVTDRGVIMFRELLRHSIRAVQDGRTPEGVLCQEADTIIGTYSNDAVVRVPPAATVEDDRQLMRATGRKLAESYLAHPPLLTGRGLEKAAGDGNQSFVRNLFSHTT
jgi:hypothetical protein